MDWTKIIQLQKDLDETLKTTHMYDDSDVFLKKKLALIVELSELANEVKVFKYWSVNKNIDHEKALFEYVDCMHFILSFSITFDIEIEKIKLKDATTDISDFILLVITKCINIDNKETCEEALSYFLTLGDLLNFTHKDIEKYYLLKNSINFKRIKDNY
ncbi:MAG: dUTP diphosphatase [Malacoplasma sp.]